MGISRVVLVPCMATLAAGFISGQQPHPSLPSELTLAHAKEFALQNNPRIRSAQSSEGAAASVTREVRSARYPTVLGHATAVEAEHSSVLAAGALQTSSLYSRVASSIELNQLVADFGRTSALTKSADLRHQAQTSNTQGVRQQVLLQVTQAYFEALGRRDVLRVARAALENRNTTLRQVRALAESSIRSTLDVRFAEVSASEAQLDLDQAENLYGEAQADLSAALGLESAQTFQLTDEPAPTSLDMGPDALIQAALHARPELQGLLFAREAAARYATAEARLVLPTVSFIGAAGLVPAGDPRLPRTFSAAGFNINIPILNGGLFSARRAEAEQRAEAAESDARALAIQVAREVRLAWLEANTAEKRVQVTAALVAQTNEALRLAQTRYEVGLGSIVELSQAQFNQTSAEIQNVASKSEYLSRRAALSYATGNLQ